MSTPVDIDVVLEDTDERPTVDVKLDKNRREKPLSTSTVNQSKAP